MPDLDERTVELIRRESVMFDATGSPVARPPAVIRSRLGLFYKVYVTQAQIAAVLDRSRAGRYPGYARSAIHPLACRGGD